MLACNENQHVSGSDDALGGIFAAFLGRLEAGHLVRRYQRSLNVFDARVDMIHDRRISLAAEVVGGFLNGLRTCHL